MFFLRGSKSTLVLCAGRKLPGFNSWIDIDLGFSVLGFLCAGRKFPSPDPSTHKRVGRDVRTFDSAVWDRGKQNAVLSGNYAQFTQNPAMKHHLWSAGNKSLDEASPLDPV